MPSNRLEGGNKSPTVIDIKAADCPLKTCWGSGEKRAYRSFFDSVQTVVKISKIHDNLEENNAVKISDLATEKNVKGEKTSDRWLKTMCKTDFHITD